MRSPCNYKHQKTSRVKASEPTAHRQQGWAWAEGPGNTECCLQAFPNSLMQREESKALLVKLPYGVACAGEELGLNFHRGFTAQLWEYLLRSKPPYAQWDLLPGNCVQDSNLIPIRLWDKLCRRTNLVLLLRFLIHGSMSCNPALSTGSQAVVLRRRVAIET